MSLHLATSTRSQTSLEPEVFPGTLWISNLDKLNGGHEAWTCSFCNFLKPKWGTLMAKRYGVD